MNIRGVTNLAKHDSYVRALIRSHDWDGVADTIGHYLPLPKFIQHRLCDRWDRYLGLTDEEIDRTGPA